MARPRKMPNTHLRHMTKEEQFEQQQNAETLEQFTSLDYLEVPELLTDIEQQEWLRLSNDLMGLPLTELDRNLLTSYCSWWSIYQEAKRHRDVHGILITEERRGEPITKRNPSIDIMSTAQREIKAIASDLGLTVNSRLQIINALNKDEEDKDDFADI